VGDEVSRRWRRRQANYETSWKPAALQHMFFFRSLFKKSKALRTLRENRYLVSLFTLFLLVFIIYLMVYEGLSLIDTYYFMVTTATTVGYGDISPASPLGKVLVTAYMVIGIAIIGMFLGKVTDLMVEMSSKRRKGLVKMTAKTDLIIAGYPGDEKVQNIVSELRNDERYKSAAIVCVTRLITEMPAWMAQLDVGFVHGVASDTHVLGLAGIESASVALILANNPGAVESDDLSTSICAVINRVNPKVRTIIEKVRLDETIFAIANAHTIVDVASPSVLAQEVLDPGAIQLQNAIFSTNTPGTQFNMKYEGTESSWREIAHAILRLDAIPEGFQNPEQTQFNLLPGQEDRVLPGALIKYRGTRLLRLTG